MTPDLGFSIAHRAALSRSATGYPHLSYPPPVALHFYERQHMNARAEQALRILDALATIPTGHSAVILAPDDISDSWRAVLNPPWKRGLDIGDQDRSVVCKGSSAQDALAQLAQHIVCSDEPWGEPGLLDSESDVDAFDRATGGEHG